MPIRNTQILLSCALLLVASVATAAPSESLRFAIRWLFVPAGTSVIQHHVADDDRVQFRVETCSNRTLDMIYKVRDRIVADARSEGDAYQPVRYHFLQREGRHHADFLADFTEAGEVAFTDRRKGQVEKFTIPDGTLDVLTAFFATRGLPLEVGQEYSIPVFDKRKSYNLIVEVLRAERRDSVLGAVDTVVIRPRMETEGIFKRTGDIYIWLTDDERHIPVHMESEVKIGSVIADLIAVDKPGPDADAERLACES